MACVLAACHNCCLACCAPECHRLSSTREQELLMRNGFRLPPVYLVCSADSSVSVCAHSEKLLCRCQPTLLHTHVPIYTQGDDNCLFCAISHCLYGFEDGPSTTTLGSSGGWPAPSDLQPRQFHVPCQTILPLHS